MSVVLVHKGRLFCFMSTPLPARICISLIIKRSKIKKDRPPKRAIWNMMQPEGLLERGTRKHYCILSITVNYQGRNERHGVILHRKVERY